MQSISIEHQCPICNCAQRYKPIASFPEKYLVIKCNDCQVESVYPMPSLQELKEYYSSYYYGDFVDSNYYQGIINFLTSRVECKNKKNISILDYGYGAGTFLKQVAKNNFSAYGIEFSSKACLAVREYCEQNNLEMQLIQIPEDSLDTLARKKIDFITLFQVIEHVLDPLKLICSLSSFQEKGQFLYLECPNNDALYLKTKNFLRKKTGRDMFFKSLNPPQHLYGFNQTSLRILLERAGYTPIEIKDYPFADGLHQVETLLWYPSLLKTLGNRERWNFNGFAKSVIGMFDPLVSKFFKAGGGLYALAYKN